MATPNVNIILQAALAAFNNLAPNAPQIATFDLGNPTLGLTSIFYDPYVQVTVAGTTIPLPNNLAFLIAVQNLDAAAVMQMSLQPALGSLASFSFGPGGGCIVFDPTKAGGGWTALSLSVTSGTISASVMVAG